jgi:hypothetical protein
MPENHDHANPRNHDVAAEAPNHRFLGVSTRPHAAGLHGRAAGAGDDRHASRGAPCVLRRALVEGLRLRHLLVCAARFGPGVRGAARLGAGTSTALVDAESDELCEDERRELCAFVSNVRRAVGALV